MDNGLSERGLHNKIAKLLMQKQLLYAEDEDERSERVLLVKLEDTAHPRRFFLFQDTEGFRFFRVEKTGVFIKELLCAHEIAGVHSEIKDENGQKKQLIILTFLDGAWIKSPGCVFRRQRDTWQAGVGGSLQLAQVRYGSVANGSLFACTWLRTIKQDSFIGGRSIPMPPSRFLGGNWYTYLWHIIFLAFWEDAIAKGLVLDKDFVVFLPEGLEGKDLEVVGGVVHKGKRLPQEGCKVINGVIQYPQKQTPKKRQVKSRPGLRELLDQAGHEAENTAATRSEPRVQHRARSRETSQERRAREEKEFSAQLDWERRKKEWSPVRDQKVGEAMWTIEEEQEAVRLAVQSSEIYKDRFEMGRLPIGLARESLKERRVKDEQEAARLAVRYPELYPNRFKNGELPIREARQERESKKREIV